MEPYASGSACVNVHPATVSQPWSSSPAILSQCPFSARRASLVRITHLWMGWWNAAGLNRAFGPVVSMAYIMLLPPFTFSSPGHGSAPMICRSISSSAICWALVAVHWMNGNDRFSVRAGVTLKSSGVSSIRPHDIAMSPCIHILYTSHWRRRSVSGPIIGVSPDRRDITSPSA
eukprot:1685775-Rhodomonas_salina.1